MIGKWIVLLDIEWSCYKLYLQNLNEQSLYMAVEKEKAMEAGKEEDGTEAEVS